MGTKFDVLSAPVGTVFFNAAENVFHRKASEGCWERYDTYDTGFAFSDRQMQAELTEDDVRYERTAEVGEEP